MVLRGRLGERRMGKLANGQLGSELRKIGFSPLDEVFFTDVAELDITDYTAIEKFIQVHEVDTIINCAAYTAVDRAEDEPGPAAEINTQAVANLAKAAQKEDCLLIHISTDYVFDGHPFRLFLYYYSYRLALLRLRS